MTKYAAFLRAVNVGGTGKLPMAELRKMCTELGFVDVQTYIASGNVVLSSSNTKAAVRKSIEKKLHTYAGSHVEVYVLTASEIQAILDNNPFPDENPSRTAVILLNQKPSKTALDDIAGLNDEKLQLGKREIYAFYPNGMGRSKLRIPAAKNGTARNINTIRKMVQLVSQ